LAGHYNDYKTKQPQMAAVLKQLQNSEQGWSGVTFRHAGVIIVIHTGARPLDLPGWYHRGNGVFVNHLGDGIAEQNRKLVKGLDLALQLDAIHQIN
jgi:hypothetical protein